jgi:hypothetical protein
MTSTNLTERVRSLGDEQAITACQSLIELIDLRLAEQQLAPKAGTVDTTNLENLVKAGGSAEQDLYENLKSDPATRSETARAARTMLLVAADLGFAEQVALACDQAQISVRDFGLISGPLVLAGLAVVLAWVPVEQRQKVEEVSLQKPDGSWEHRKITNIETIRVGSAAAEKLAAWLKYLVPGGG